MNCFVWIVEISWSKSATPQLTKRSMQRRLLLYLGASCPYFVNRPGDVYTLALSLKAERLSEAEQKADDLLKQALVACNLPWPSSRRKICDITSQR